MKTSNTKPARGQIVVSRSSSLVKHYARRSQGKIYHLVRPTLFSFENPLAFKNIHLTLPFWNRKNLKSCSLQGSLRLYLELLHVELAAQDFEDLNPCERSPPIAEHSVTNTLMVVFRLGLGSNFCCCCFIFAIKKILKLNQECAVQLNWLSGGRVQLHVYLGWLQREGWLLCLRKNWRRAWILHNVNG